MPDLRSVHHAHAVTIVGPMHEHVVVSWRNEGESGNETVAIDGFAYLQLALGIETLGQRMRKYGRDVLDNRDGGQIAGESRQHFTQGFGATGGRAEKNESAKRGESTGMMYPTVVLVVCLRSWRAARLGV